MIKNNLWYLICGWNLCIFFWADIGKKTENGHIFWLRSPRRVFRLFFGGSITWSICGWNSIYYTAHFCDLNSDLLIFHWKKMWYSISGWNLIFFRRWNRGKALECWYLLIKSSQSSFEVIFGGSIFWIFFPLQFDFFHAILYEIKIGLSK